MLFFSFSKDTYAADSESRPLIDKIDDFTLLDSKEIDGYTILKFTRKLITCDTDEDVEIRAGTSYLIFAWNPQDPATGLNDWAYHTPDRRRTKTVLLIDNKNELTNILPDDTFTADLKIRNVNLLIYVILLMKFIMVYLFFCCKYQIPSKRTTYYCDIFKIPKFDTNVHLIQFEIIIEKKNLLG